MLLLLVFAIQANNFIFTPINVLNGLSDNQIRYILQLPDGRMVFTTSGSVNIYDGASFVYLHRPPDYIYPLKQYDGHYRIYQCTDSLLWIKDSYRLSCLNLYEGQYMTSIEEYFQGLGVQEPIEDFFVDDLYGMWLLTEKGLLQHKTSRFYDLSANKGKLQDLVTDAGCVYLFYNTGEVTCYDMDTGERLYSSSAYPVSQQGLFEYTSLVVKGRKGFYQLRNGSKGGFFFFDPQKRSWEKRLETDYALNTLIVTQEEVAYISCPQGFWVIDNESKQYLPVLKTIDGRTIDTEISTLFHDKQGGLWLGTLNRGLLYYHPSRYKFTYIGRSCFLDSSSRDIVVQAFAEDEKGDIYVRCSSKIYKYDPLPESEKVLMQVAVSSLSEKIMERLMQTPENLFRGEYYTAVCVDSRGWTWAGTEDGLRLFTSDTEPVVFYKENGLSNSFVQSIYEDRNQRIWVTTSYGISQFRIDSIDSKIHITNFNTYDGTLEGEYAQGAIYEAIDGAIYFGGVDGFNILYPENLSFSRLPFKPVFTNLRLRGEEVKPGKEYDRRVVLSQTTPYTERIELSYNQNFLTFEFSALNYQNPSQTIYRYLLEGIDPEWRETPVGEGDTDGVLRLSYTNLPVGRYTLKVTAADNDHRWEGVITELVILIHAPWWKTRTAYLLYTILLALILFGSVYVYIYVTRKKLERAHKEEMLLIRIRHLIEQCNLYEEEQKSRLPENRLSVEATFQTSADECAAQSAADAEFLSRAMKLVEKNLDVPGYSVEQLGRDLCMDRTGLYRKLITLLDKSPSIFIRNIRLQKAAQLILEENLSIAEIAERVGFSSSSYLSKCFQEMYGCRPTEYAQKAKKST